MQILIQNAAMQIPLIITDRGGKARPRPYFSLRYDFAEHQILTPIAV